MMKQVAQAMPTANIAINKSRLKLYNKNSNIPTYYLEKGQEFQIELFNPTKDTVLATISLNNKSISQGGLVLKPGERVFLDRYLDVAKKFMFDTYEVANTEEVRKAIEDNGDFKVEFYREDTYIPPQPTWNQPIFFGGPITRGTGDFYDGTLNTTTNVNYSQPISGDITLTSMDMSNTTNIGATLDSMDLDLGQEVQPSPLRGRKPNPTNKPRLLKKKKSIETGRVEQGSTSDQKFETVSKKWEFTPFHTIEYKMLPVSQKVNTVQDIQVKRYCTNCGSKNKPNFKFCPNCGTKI
jgi:hypothetical protein